MYLMFKNAKSSLDDLTIMGFRSHDLTPKIPCNKANH